jgi:hypothetical protein
MPPTKSEDLAFGLASESRNRATIEAFLNVTLHKTGTYDAMDMCDDDKTIFVEMKTRRIRHNDYPTALIGKNKIDFCESSGADCYIIYVYTDGIFYIKYNRELFGGFRCDPYERGQRAGGIQPRQLFYFIPHGNLTPLTSPSPSV